MGQLIETREKVFKVDVFDREVITKWTYNSIGDVASCIEAVGTPEQKVLSTPLTTSAKRFLH